MKGPENLPNANNVCNCAKIAAPVHFMVLAKPPIFQFTTEQRYTPWKKTLLRQACFCLKTN
jgi:hypothetical protein